MRMKLDAKDDGLWLLLGSHRTKKNACIRIGPPDDKTPNLITQVITEVWQELREGERLKKIKNLDDDELGQKLFELSRGFEHETRWMIEEAIQRMDVDLDK